MSKAKIIELNETNICQVCDNALGKYACPRCYIRYCSLPCYQSQVHLQCSEEYYKECILEELSSQNTEESKKKMTEILQQNQFAEPEAEDSIDSDDDEDIMNITERLKGVDLDNADQIWEKLTEDEQQEFIAFLKTKDVTKLIPAWAPWWLHSSKSVEEVGKSAEYKGKCPEIIPVKNFKDLSKKPPATCVQFNLINVIAAYAFATRYFNGEHHDFSKEVTTCIITVSLSLKANQNFDDFETAIKSVEFQCTESDWIMADLENFATLHDDVRKILQGPHPSERTFYVMSALSDLYRLLNEALHNKNNKSNFSKIFPNDHFPQVKLESNNKIKTCIRKTEYLLSYAKDVFVSAL